MASDITFMNTEYHEISSPYESGGALVQEMILGSPGGYGFELRQEPYSLLLCIFLYATQKLVRKPITNHQAWLSQEPIAKRDKSKL